MRSRCHSEELRAIWAVAARAAYKAFESDSPAYLALAEKADKAFEEYDRAVAREILASDAPLRGVATDPIGEVYG